MISSARLFLSGVISFLVLLKTLSHSADMNAATERLVCAIPPLCWVQRRLDRHVCCGHGGLGIFQPGLSRTSLTMQTISLAQTFFTMTEVPITIDISSPVSYRREVKNVSTSPLDEASSQHIARTASTTNMDRLPTSCSPLPYCSTPIGHTTFSHNLLSII